MLGVGTPAPLGSLPSSVTDFDPLPACSQFPHGSVVRHLLAASAQPQQPECSGSPGGSVGTRPAHWPVSPLSSLGPWLSFVKCRLSAGPEGLVNLGTGEFSQGSSALWRRGRSKRVKMWVEVRLESVDCPQRHLEHMLPCQGSVVTSLPVSLSCQVWDAQVRDSVLSSSPQALDMVLVDAG